MARGKEAQKEIPEVFVNGLAGESLHLAGADLDVWESELPDCPFTPEELPSSHLEIPPPLFDGQEAVRYARGPEGNLRAVQYFLSGFVPRWGTLEWVEIDRENLFEYLMRVNAERFCEQVIHQLMTRSPWLDIIYGGAFPENPS
jgi:hypothetical protein